MSLNLHSLTTNQYFYSLAILAVILLWGVSLVNGTVFALLKTAYFKQLPDGTPFETNYTGIVVLDFPIALLVAFFYYGTNGHDPGYQIFLLYAYLTLQPAFVWLHIETARIKSKLSFTQSPIFFGLLWQMFGAAISLPLFYAQHLSWGIESQTILSRHYNFTRAVPFGFLLGAIIPVFIGMYPTWTGEGVRSPRAHQLILAGWQPDPIWVSLIQSAVTMLLSQVSLPRYDDRKSSVSWARATYLLAALLSTGCHLYITWTMVFTDDSRQGLVRMFVPFLIQGPMDAGGILVKGPFLFLQYDFIIIALSSLSWSFVILSRLGMDWQSLLLYLGGGSFLVGPGATVSMALWWREGIIQSHPELAQPDSKQSLGG